MTRLSVNLNKIALLRNSRRTGVPDVLHFAKLAYNASAGGITVHPRPDERHVRRDDVFALADLMRSWPRTSTRSADPDALEAGFERAVIAYQRALQGPNSDGSPRAV